jgi:hypothetical protein
VFNILNLTKRRTLVNLKKTALTLAVSAAVGAGAMQASANLTGVPSEAMLVPFMAQDYDEATGPPINDTDEVFSAVIVTTPGIVGTDTVMNVYTAPNTTTPLGVYTAPDEMIVHWYAFTEESEHLKNGTFEMTPDDTYLWSPRDNELREWIGYIVFADDAAKDGAEAASFVMTGYAFMTMSSSCSELGDEGSGLCPESDDTSEALTLPVIPMADGVDPLCDEPTVGYQCAEDAGNAAEGITLLNHVVSENPNPNSATRDRVGHVSPLAAGTRMQNPNDPADGSAPTFANVVMQALYSPFEGNWTHVFWFSENLEDRTAQVDSFDDEENYASCPDLDLPNELNAYVYADWDNRYYDLIEGFRLATDNDGRTEFEDACVQTLGNVGDPGENCAPICTPASFNNRGPRNQEEPGIGMFQYTLDAGPNPTSTGVFFEFITHHYWGSSRGTAIGNDFDIPVAGYYFMTDLGKY